MSAYSKSQNQPGTGLLEGEVQIPSPQSTAIAPLQQSTKSGDRNDAAKRRIETAIDFLLLYIVEFSSVGRTAFAEDADSNALDNQIAQKEQAK